VLKAEGYSIITDPDVGRPVEHDTFTCGHCMSITFTQPGRAGGPPRLAVIQFDQSVTMREVHRCRSCWRFICPKCEKTAFNCTPYERKIEEEEATTRRLILP